MRRSCLFLYLFSCTSCAAALLVTLVRHGETEWNSAGRLQGASDSALTPLGVLQAKACGRRLHGRTFTAAYCSPLLRARRTAELVIGQLDKPPELCDDDRLRERCFGAWEGLRWDTIQTTYAEELKQSQDDPTYAIQGGGESRAEVLARALAFLNELARTHGRGDRVLLVTHSATATVIIKHVLGLRPEARRSFEVRNLALNEIECRVDPAKIVDGEPIPWMLLTLGDCAHLEELEDDYPVNI